MGEIAGKHVLVTGGGGFVGAPTIAALIATGARVRVLDLAAPRLEGIDCEMVIGDLRDESVVAGACADVDALVHLAVLPLTLANTDHANAFEANVRGSYNVFRAAGDAGVRRIVYSSASSAYGATDEVPIHEEHPLRPTAFYPATKAAAEMILRGLAGAYGYGYAILRYMNVYGPGQRAGVVPAVAGRLLAGERPVLNGDGSQAFDFVHIDDCAEANLRALGAEVSEQDFNVGSGQATSLNELVSMLGDLLGERVEPKYQGEAAPTPPRVGDVSKARELLGFEARVALPDGLRSVLDELRGATLTAGGRSDG
jgi:UDP-glucose 4-epimerase